VDCLFLRVIDTEQIKYSCVQSIIITESGTFIKVDSDYPLDSNVIQITEEEWNALQSPELETTEPTEPPETVEQKLARLEEQNLILMDALADLYEEILTLKEEDV